MSPMFAAVRSRVGVFWEIVSGFLRMVTLMGALFVVFGSVFVGAATVFQPASIVIENLEQSYTGGTHQVSASVSPDDDYVLAITYNGKTTLPVNAGTYTVKVTATGATHKGTATAKLIVKKVLLDVRADDKGRLLGAANPIFTLSYSGFVNGETFTVIDKKPAGVPAAKSTSPAGSYPINVVGGSDNNYDFTRIPGVLTVSSFYSGNYETLLFKSGSENPIGKLDLTLPSKGDVFTGILHLAAETKSVSFKGKLSSLALDYASVSGALNISIGTHVYALGLTLTEDGVFPSITYDQSAVSDFYDPVAVIVHTKSSPAAWIGTYTLALTNPNPSDFFRSYPAGASIGTVTVAYTGVLSMSGKLADGTSFTASSKPDNTGTYRFFVRPHGARADSFLGGSFTFVPHPDENRSGKYYSSTADTTYSPRVYWAKAPKPVIKVTDKGDPTYPDGFGALDYFVDIDPWLPPVAAKKGVAAISLVDRLALSPDDKGAGVLRISHGEEYFGEYDFDLPLMAAISAKGAISPVFDPAFISRAKWKMSASATTGRFTGGFVLKDTVASPTVSNPLATKVFTRTISFQGVLRQGPSGSTLIGVGYLMLPPLPDDAFNTTPVSTEIRFTMLDE